MTPAEQLAKEIQDEAGIADSNLAFVASVVWLNPRGETTVWRHMDLVPNNMAMRIFLMFHDASEVRVYALPASDPKEGQKPAPPTRYTIPKAQCLVAESMNLDAFKRETVVELRVAADIDDESVDCPKCGEENAETAAYCNACGDRLLPTFGEEEKDEKEEEKKSDATATIPAAPVASA